VHLPNSIYKNEWQASITFETNWKGGTISNFTSFLHKEIWKKNRIPSALIISLNKVGDYWGENFKRYPIFILFFIDTIHNIFKFDSFAFINNKSLITTMYFYYVFISFIKSLFILRKIRFFEKIKKQTLYVFNKNSKIKNSV
jgi:hypothetical protein